MWNFPIFFINFNLITLKSDKIACEFQLSRKCMCICVCAFVCAHWHIYAHISKSLHKFVNYTFRSLTHFFWTYWRAVNIFKYLCLFSVGVWVHLCAEAHRDQRTVWRICFSPTCVHSHVGSGDLTQVVRLRSKSLFLLSL